MDLLVCATVTQQFSCIMFTYQTRELEKTPNALEAQRALVSREIDI